jgi:copper chaperone CopZ
MKTFSLFLKSSFFAFALFLVSCNSSGGETVIEKPEVIADASSFLAIEGMMCVKGCVGTITKNLQSTPGVGEFDIQFEEGTATIAYDSKQITEDEIIAKISTIADGAYKAYVVNFNGENNPLDSEELVEEVSEISAE